MNAFLAFNNGAKATMAVVKLQLQWSEYLCQSCIQVYALGSMTLAMSLSLIRAISSIFKSKYTRKEVDK